MRKGTPRHRINGAIYIASMFVVIVSVIPVEATTLRIGSSRFGFFHVFIVIGFISLCVGLAALRRWRRTGRPKDLRSHQVNFAYSYAGLLMAGFSQIATNPMWGLVEGMGVAQFWITFAALNAAIYAVATWLIVTRIAKRDPLSFMPGKTT
ncbi:hypothetical protein HME9302_00751 [Alteripontixanthobacter maritimus]|uniref:DUF2306 domain-containing protein n=2 Tax=Alteripontixanthobacter maritimus TaxID=2161824 RepID=A0A369Q3V1_9SPHN|nr:hypothetical protein HME9302_00751 [Alteripontixanthobacter maritimus]